MDTLPDRVRWILKQRGWSQRELAKRAGLASSHVSLLLNQLGDGITSKTLEKIAAASGVSMDWLTNGEGDPLAQLRFVPDDPAPERTAALAPFRDSPDPIVREAVAQIASAAHSEGVAHWSRERWTRSLLQRIDELRADALDPSRVETRRAESRSEAGRALAQSDARKAAARAQNDADTRKKPGKR